MAVIRSFQPVKAWSPEEIVAPGDLPAVQQAPQEAPAGSPPVWEPAEFAPDATMAWAPLFETVRQALQPVESQARTPLIKPAEDGLPAWNPQELAPPVRAGGKPLGGIDRSEAPGQGYNLFREAQRKAADLLRQAKIQADELLLRAEAQAADLVRAAEAQASELARQAYADGQAAANAETEELLRTATAIVQEVNAWREGQFTQGEMMLLRLVIEIAQSIFGEGLPLEPEALGQAFARALAQAKTLGDLRVYVHPEDAAALGSFWTQRQTALSGQGIELVSSDIIKRGGCFVEGQYGSVDARVETQLLLVKDTLMAVDSLAPAAGGSGG